jgi:endonuclease G
MKTIPFLILLVISNGLFAQLELPKYNADDIIVKHTGYTLSYNSKFKQANWVAYLLTKDETVKRFQRGEFFAPDPLIPGTDFKFDYLKSGYDRGHLAPAAVMGYSMETMVQSFYYSNMSPQVPRFNRGVWKKLEMQVRNWAIAYDSLCVVTGPIFSDSIKVIGPHRVAVPKAYYKVILDNHRGKEKMIGFVLNNDGDLNSFQSFVVSVDSVELITGIDFFSNLDDVLESKMEKMICNECWGLTILKNSIPKIRTKSTLFKRVVLFFD